MVAIIDRFKRTDATRTQANMYAADSDSDGDIDLRDFAIFGSQFASDPTQCTP